MKSIIYKNPVISGIFLNLLAMLLSIYGIKYMITSLIFLIVPVGIVNRKILDNGINMNGKKKLILLVSFGITIGVLLLYGRYITGIRNNEIINS